MKVEILAADLEVNGMGYQGPAGHVHCCMRCGIVFPCQNPSTCQAQYEVIGYIRGEVFVDHCPPNPDWDWIRRYAMIRHRQLTDINDGLIPGRDGGRCTLRDGVVLDDGYHSWRCCKEAEHPGACSSHNDCGHTDESGTCGYARNHAGRHAVAEPTEGETK